MSIGAILLISAGLLNSSEN